MAWVLKDSTTIDGVLYLVDTTPPDAVAAQVGEHLRKEVGSVGSSVSRVDEPEPEPIVLEPQAGDGSAVFQETPPAVEPEASAAEEVPPAGTADQGAPEAPVPSEDAPQAPSEGSPEVFPEAPEQPADPPPVAPSEPADVEVPNRGGKGSSTKHWLEYAHAKGVEVTDDMERHEVIDACRAKNVPVD